MKAGTIMALGCLLFTATARAEEIVLMDAFGVIQRVTVYKMLEPSVATTIQTDTTGHVLVSRDVGARLIAGGTVCEITAAQTIECRSEAK